MKEILDTETNFSGQKQKVPNAGGVLTLGILSIVLAGFVGLILGIIGLSISSKPRELYLSEPKKYDESSYKMMNAGRICSIIGLSISALAILIIIMASA